LSKIINSVKEISPCDAVTYHGGLSVLHFLAMTPAPHGHGYIRILDLVELMQNLVCEWDADVNCMSKEGARSRTPLHVACHMALGLTHGRHRVDAVGPDWFLAIVEALIAFGADIESTDDNGWTPLALTIGGSSTHSSSRRTACVEFLLDRGANPKRAKAALGGRTPAVGGRRVEETPGECTQHRDYTARHQGLWAIARIGIQCQGRHSFDCKTDMGHSLRFCVEG